MMLAQAVNLNILDNNHLIVSLLKDGVVDNILHVDLVSLGQEQQSLGVS